MIEVKNLCKSYGSHKAVDDLSFTIEKGNVYGFLGPNGAGKSTTMNILTGCLAATSGEVFIDGHDIFEEALEAKKLIGYLPEIPPLYQDMTVNEYLKFVARVKGVSKEKTSENLIEVMEKTQTQDVSGRLIKNLSKGYKQRVGIAQALIGNPEVIILDEPTVGLDPKQIIEIRDLIRELGENHTVILSSHILPEVRAVCNKIMIVSKGRLVASDTLENVEKLLSSNETIELQVKTLPEEANRLLSQLEDIENIKCQADEKLTGYTNVWLEYSGQHETEVREKIFEIFSLAQKPIIKMDISVIDLEEVFLDLTKEEGSDESNLS